MNNSFLNNVATDLYQRYGDKLSDCCVVFPNRRASLFFTRYLSDMIARPIWAPSFSAINELMQQLSQLQLADNLSLIFDLYEIYKKLKNTDETFDEFYFWGETMLSDFDDVDKNLVNAADLFKNIESLKDLRDRFEYLTDNQIQAIRVFWKNFNLEHLTAQKQNFISVWNILQPIYETYTAMLKDKGIGYEGMIYREAVKRLNEDREPDLPYQKIIFVGFNALNKCEKTFFKILQNLNIAEFYWDYDDYYLNNPVHEAGQFIRENLRDFPPAATFPSNNLKGKKFTCIAVPSAVGQARVLPSLLHQLGTPDYDTTAVVLADEQMLMPVLHSIPSDIRKINVTMGYPVTITPVYSFLEELINLQRNVRVQQNGQFIFYYKNVQSILKHPYSQYLHLKLPDDFSARMVNENKIFLKPSDFGDDKIVAKIFSKPSNPSEFADYMMDILYTAAENLDQKGPEEDEDPEQENKADISKVESEYLYYLFKAIKRLKEVLSEKNIDFSLVTFTRLLKKYIRGLSVPFTGEPLSGLQVMGILETRAVDFENIIILSMNEGNLPKSGTSPSFIPYSLRKAFGLPTIEHQDSIYAYYFYRLVQRAKNVVFTYNSRTDDSQTGEMSRFLIQLKYEPGFTIEERNITYNVNIQPAKEIKISKNGEIMKALLAYTGKAYLSPSAINTYIDCSLKFYFKYIAQIEEAQEVSEEVDEMMFGNLLHKSMEYLYREEKGTLLQKENLHKMISDKNIIREALQQAFKEVVYKTEDFQITGRNAIIFNVLKKYITRLLIADEAYSPFKILELERFCSFTIPMSFSSQAVQVNIGGIIDRVDDKEGNIRIIDYKTGEPDKKFSSIESLFDSMTRKRNKAALQTFIYSQFYASERPEAIAIVPGLYFLKELFGGNWDYHLETGIRNKVQKITNYRDIAQEFEVQLYSLLANLFNKDLPFEQTANQDTCRLCPYNGMCHR